MTAAAAVGGIRELDPQGSIGLISAEPHRPYQRPPLTKGLWKGKPLEKIYFQLEQQGAELFLGRQVESLEVASRRVWDDQGRAFTYERLLLATGGEPRQLPFGRDQILYFRTLDHYHYLRERAGAGRRFAVIGGGFIGSELAAILATAGQRVTMVFPEQAIGARLFPTDLAAFLNEYYREKGVEVRAGELVTGLERRDGGLSLLAQSGPEIAADEVVAGIGLRPNTTLAEAAGIEIADGILVDECLRTSQPDIYAAGDVANFYNPILDRRMRVEHEDNALTMGTLAGRNMAGAETPYHHLPCFYSRMFDLDYDAVGELDSETETYADWQEPYRKGVVYYLKEGRVRGVLLWNIRGQLEAARRLIAQPGPFERRTLKARLPAA
jgi:NADPH-dependent 2,4-dienoyl-CoA reductase/sulfur reductase-like enzyme